MFLSVTAEFAQVCEQSTDFHFSDLEQQFEVIDQHVDSACEWRAQQQKLRDDADRVSLKSTGSSSSEVGKKLLVEQFFSEGGEFV